MTLRKGRLLESELECSVTIAKTLLNRGLRTGTEAMVMPTNEPILSNC